MILNPHNTFYYLKHNAAISAAVAHGQVLHFKAYINHKIFNIVSKLKVLAHFQILRPLPNNNSVVL